MSILETVTRVREAEKEAARILEEAHREEKAAVTEALDRRRTLLAKAKETARGSVLLIEKGLGKEKEEQLLLLASKVEKEKKGLRETARHRSEEALRAVLELFLSSCRKDR
jgi:cell division septum initiation protein DivIVA